MKRHAQLTVFFVLAITACWARAQQEKQNQPQRYESTEKKIRFDYPAVFVVGQHDDTTDRTDFFRRAIVLVEKSRLGDADPRKLKTGTVSIKVVSLEEKDSEFWRTIGFDNPNLWKVEPKDRPLKMKIGPHEAVKLPGFPGPYGDRVYVYLVERPDGRIVALLAQKQFLDNDRTPTGYDKTIEGIIETLSFLK